MNNFIKQLPKVELHLHIEGSLEAELMFELAKRNNIKLPFATIDDVKAAYEFGNLQDFLDIYYAGCNVLITEQDFYDLTITYFKKSHEQNIIHSEIFFDPQSHTSRGIAIETVVKGIRRAMKDAKQKWGITGHLILSFLRHLPEEDAISTLNNEMEAYIQQTLPIRIRNLIHEANHYGTKDFAKYIQFVNVQEKGGK